MAVKNESRKSKSEENPRIETQSLGCSGWGILWSFPLGRWSVLLGSVWLSFAASAENSKPVIYYHDLVPIFKRSCTGCQHPGKLKGELDLTTYEAFLKGGKHGPGFKTGDVAGSMIVEEISGAEPSMPKEGDPLAKAEVAMVERWIREGGLND